MQIRVITFQNTSPLLTELKDLFPLADVSVQRGIDLRNSPIDLLFDAGMISHTVVHTLQHGRRWDHEIPSKGAIGLAHANRLALQEDIQQPLLLVEEDCVILDGPRLKHEVEKLLVHQDKFDLATFGALKKGNRPSEKRDWLPNDFVLLQDKFWLMHCVLYTPSGRKKVSDLLQKPLEMQIDSLYGSEAQLGNLTVAAQLHRRVVRQSIHVSSVQTPLNQSPGRKVGRLVVVLALVWYLGWHTRKVFRKP